MRARFDLKPSVLRVRFDLKPSVLRAKLQYETWLARHRDETTVILLFQSTPVSRYAKFYGDLEWGSFGSFSAETRTVGFAFLLE